MEEANNAVEVEEVVEEEIIVEEGPDLANTTLNYVVFRGLSSKVSKFENFYRKFPLNWFMTFIPNSNPKENVDSQWFQSNFGVEMVSPLPGYTRNETVENGEKVSRIFLRFNTLNGVPTSLFQKIGNEFELVTVMYKNALENKVISLDDGVPEEYTYESLDNLEGLPQEVVEFLTN